MSDEHEWVHQALAALSRPELPDEVRNRLDAAIEAQGPVAGSVGADGAEAAITVPAQATYRTSSAPRRRPRILGMAGAAAALVLFAMVDPFGGAPLQQSDSGSFGTAEAPEGLASEGTTAPESGIADAFGALEEPAAQIEQVLIASGTDYTRSGFASQVAATAAVPADQQPRSADAPGAASCVAALPGEGQLVFVDRAAFEGRPALVVARLIGTELRVFVLNPSCTSTDPQIQYRATVEAPRRSAGE